MAYTLPDMMIKNLINKEIDSIITTDYESGTFTATLKGETADPTTPVTVTGVYVKIGKQVTVSVRFINVNTTGSAGPVNIAGLPFACASNQDFIGGLTQNIDTSNYVCRIRNNSNIIDGVLLGNYVGVKLSLNGTLNKYLVVTVTYLTN